MAQTRIDIPKDEIAEFCQRWKITEFGVFGSILRSDFRPDSDVDVLVTFAQDTSWTLFDMVQMQDELKKIFGREVDLVSRRGLESSRNYLRRREIFDTVEIIHAA